MSYQQNPELLAMRQKLDDLDQQIVLKLVQRYEAALEVLKWKKKHNCPLHAPEREWRIHQRAVKMARSFGLAPEHEDFIRMLYFQIIAHPFKKYYQHEFLNET